MIEDKLCMLACNVFKEEIKAILDSPEFNDIELVIYPHVCLNPSKEMGEMESILEKYRSTYKHVIFLNEKCNYRNVKGKTSANFDDMKAIYRCLELIAGKSLLTYLRVDEKNYIVTPGWLRTWREHIETWGMDGETARRFFSQSINKVILLDTGICTGSKISLTEFADYIGLPFERIDIGLEFMKQSVNRQITSWRTDRDCHQKEAQITELNNQLVKYKIMCEMSGMLKKLDDESKVILTSIDFIKILTEFNRIIYTPVIENTMQEPVPRLVMSPDEKDTITAFINSGEAYSWLASGTGFIIRLQYLLETIGVLYMKDAVLKECLKDYLNLVMMVTNPLALAISNIRHCNRLKDTQNLLSIQTVTDPLTETLNRHTIIERLEVEISRAQREQKPLSVAMLDIDHFKKVNDTYGYSVGDRVLIKVVEQAKAALRPYDYIGRFGGEEFLIVIPGADILDATAISERILSRIENNTMQIEDNEINVTVSLGVSTFTGNGINIADSLINTSNIALHRAKNEGRNRVVHHNTPDTHEKM
jgi:diguanylate cyclase (GGDEF)-like protein